MSEILKDGMPCVEKGENQINSEGLPEASYKTELVQEQMNKML